MKFLPLYRLVSKLALLLLPVMAGAQTYFTDTQFGDVNAGFRKLGASEEAYETVVYLGNITNFLALAPGTQITISNLNKVNLTNMCPDNFGNLRWSVFSGFTSSFGNMSSPVGSIPISTIWYTVARTNVNDETTPAGRLGQGNANNASGNILSVSTGARNVSQALVTDTGNTNVNNNTLVVLEPTSGSYAELDDNLTAFIDDTTTPGSGDFGGGNSAGYLNFSVENITPSSFTTPVVSDFYMNVPGSSGRTQNIDPITGQANGNADYLGYFTLNSNGSMTFTRASSTAPAPVAGFSGTPTTGFAPLAVNFTDASTGSITNWIWNLGDGQSVTNSSNASVNHTYTTAGHYTVTLTVQGPGGPNTDSQTGYITALPQPKITTASVQSGGQLVLGGTNCPVGVQYRILTSTNVALPLASWTPMVTNTFLANGTYAYTNSTSGKPAAFFLLVSP